MDAATVAGAVYSPSDIQIKPTALTNAFVKAASLKGVQCLFGEKVVAIIAVKVVAKYISKTRAYQPIGLFLPLD